MRKRYSGRAMPREVKLIALSDQEVSVMVSSDKQVHWWHGTTELLGLLSRRKSKGGGAATEEHIAHRIQARANGCKHSEHLHLSKEQEATWQEALMLCGQHSQKDLEEMAAKAKENAEKGAREIAKETGAKYKEWILQSSANKIGALHRHVKDEGRTENELKADQSPSPDPASMMEEKRKHYAEKWLEEGDTQEELLNALEEVRRTAEREEKGQYAIQSLDKVLSYMSDGTGRGSDNIGPGDAKALPKEGREDLCKVLQEIDLKLAWPWQTLITIVALLKKPAR